MRRFPLSWGPLMLRSAVWTPNTSSSFHTVCIQQKDDRLLRKSTPCPDAVMAKRFLRFRNKLKERGITSSITLMEPDPKLGYSKELTASEAAIAGYDALPHEFGKLRKEFQDWIDDDHRSVRPGDRDVVWTFNTKNKSPTSGGYSTHPENVSSIINPTTSLNTPHDIESSGSEFDNWMASCDSDWEEGESTCTFYRSPAGHAVFEGYLCTKLRGNVEKAGWTNISAIKPRKSFQRKHYYHWGQYSHLVLRVRGDGRSYMINLGRSGHFDLTSNNYFHYPLYTRGGPHWQTYKIPFSKFYFANKGTIQDSQIHLDKSQISLFGITLGDNNEGRFRLEIDYVAVEYDITHTEQSAYEQYKTKKIWS